MALVLLYQPSAWGNNNHYSILVCSLATETTLYYNEFVTASEATGYPWNTYSNPGNHFSASRSSMGRLCVCVAERTDNNSPDTVRTSRLVLHCSSDIYTQDTYYSELHLPKPQHWLHNMVYWVHIRSLCNHGLLPPYLVPRCLGSLGLPVWYSNCPSHSRVYCFRHDSWIPYEFYGALHSTDDCFVHNHANCSGTDDRFPTKHEFP